jgi:hypothetical protein
MAGLTALLGITERLMAVDIAVAVIVAVGILYLFRSGLDYSFSSQTAARGLVGLLWLAIAVLLATRLVKRLFDFWAK